MNIAGGVFDHDATRNRYVVGGNLYKLRTSAGLA
jgi:hypothetical protein